MIRLIKTTILSLIVIITLSCSEDDELEVDSSFIIEFGSECGWCAGTTYISIKKGEIEYTRNIPCGDKQGIKTEKKEFDSDKWEALIAEFDFDYFSSLEYTNCNVCADGCDEIIKITKDDKSHEIRYNPSEDIKGLELFQEKLREYLTEYYEAN